ncbi:hypothetical protein L7F22_063677 [Adiantum nelumboides]|nr:hypothetical protein [Adiantum nelumboides]
MGSLASTSQISQAETHVHVQLPYMPDMPDLPSTSQHDEEHQGPAPRALDVRGDLEQNIANMPAGPTKEFLIHERKVMESAALAFLQQEEQVKSFGHKFLPLPLIRHEAILWKENMRPMLPRNKAGVYEEKDERNTMHKSNLDYDYRRENGKRYKSGFRSYTLALGGQNFLKSELGEDPKHAYIATPLTEEEEKLLIATLKQYKDVFAWSYKYLKGVDPSICQHTILLKSDAKPGRQRPYTYNETFAKKIKEEIDKLKEAKFIYEIEHTDLVSPIMVAPKKNGKLRVCINIKKVNAATIRDNYSLPITNHVLERVARREAYNFLDGFAGYNQLAIKPEDQHKMAFATEWGIFGYKVIPFGLTNAPVTFQRLMSHAF